MSKPIRQGDVLLVPVAALPASAKPVKREADGAVVLAWGEVTGHRHAIADPGVSLYEDGATRYIMAAKSAPLVHEEHGTVKVPPGVHRVQIHDEWTDELEPRQVLD